MRTFEEIEKEAKVVNERHRKLLELPNEEFLKPEVTKELTEIHKKELELAKELLNLS